MLVYQELWVVALVNSLLVVTLPRLRPSAHSSPGLGWDLVKAALHMKSVEQRLFLLFCSICENTVYHLLKSTMKL